MKSLLIPLALVASQAMACPDGASKDAMATPSDKPLFAAKNTATSALATSLATTPAAKLAKAPAANVTSAKSDTKLALKSGSEVRKPAPL